MQPRTAWAIAAILALAALCVAEADATNAASAESYKHGHKHEGKYEHKDHYDHYEHKPDGYEHYEHRPDDYERYAPRSDYGGDAYQHKGYPIKPTCTGCGQCSVGTTATGPAGTGACPACEACPTGSTTAAVGAATCNVCLPGYGGASSCSMCLAGTYSTGGAGAVCQNCPDGKSSNDGAQSPADCQDAACLAEGYIGVVVPSDGTVVEAKRVPECRTLSGALTDCLGGDPQDGPVVPFYIEPAATDRIITVTTCPQRTDPVVSSVDTVISALSVSTDGTCSLTYETCNDDWTDDYSAQAIVDLCETYDDYLSYLEITVPANEAYVVTVTTYDEDYSCADGTADPITPFKVFISESCIENCPRKGNPAAKKPLSREQHRADKQKKCAARGEKKAPKKAPKTAPKKTHV